MAKRIIIPDPSIKYWRVALTEQVGEVTIACNVRHIPAKDKKEAGEKAMLFYLKRQGADRQPRFKSIELEDYSRPIVI